MSQRFSGNVMAFVAMIFWATTFPGTVELLDSWHPLLLTPMRVGIAAVFLVYFLLLTGGAGDFHRAPWGRIWWLGGGILALSNVLFVWGQSNTGPVTAAILLSTMPVISAVIGFFTRNERITAPIAAGVVLAVVGGYFASLEPGAGLLSVNIRGGEPVLFTAVVLFVWYSRETSEKLAGISVVAQSAFTFVTATVTGSLFAVAALASGLVEPAVDFTLRSVGLMIWIGGLGVGLATALWFGSARRLGVTITSMHHNLVPFYVMIMAAAVGAPVYPTQILGGVLVIAGALLAQLPFDTWLLRLRREAV